MQPPSFAFSTRQDAAAQLRVAAREAQVELWPLPYSRYEPEDTTWWLTPDTAKVAYAFGKIVIESPTIVDDGATLIGLHVEKGVGESAAPIFEETARGSRLVTQRDWRWHRFRRDLVAGVGDEALASARVSAEGLPVCVEVVASRQNLPRMDQSEVRPIDPTAVDRIRYEATDHGLELVARKTPERLVHYGQRETLASIGEKIAAIPDLDWTWVEVLAGVPLRPASDGLSASEVWRRACEPWLRWVS
jgi:hypothetical protein